MKIGDWITDVSVRNYRAVTAGVLIATVAVAVLAALPSIKPGALAFLAPVKVDTDPENMLSADEPARAFHAAMKEEMSLHDMVVVGVVNEVNPDGVFNPSSLRRIYELTEYARTLQWREAGGKWAGVIDGDMIAPSMVDNIEPGGPGEVRFSWLMRTPPDTGEEARAVRDKALRIPFLNDTLVSSDGRAVAIYLPLTRKDLSHRVYSALNERMPVLWMWAPLRHAIESGVTDARARQALVSVGRLAAFEAADREEFARTVLGIAGRWVDGVSTASTATLDAGLDAASTASDDGKTAAQIVLGALESGKVDAAWHAVARYFIQSRETSDASPAKLAADTRAFLHETAASLDAASKPPADLPARMESVLDARADYPGPDKTYITGLPVAEDTFGVEMFVQMAISAPAAMLVIFILMFVFFRKLVLIISPMIVAMVSVIITMGALVIAGYPIHIMSSMIPIFIMPIAVLDSIHIISEFFERYQETRDRGKTIRGVMRTLFAPMLYTSLTSAAGFLSLALTPIPPVQVFGVFVALGIMVAWLLTVSFVPAFVMLIPERSLADFGAARRGASGGATALSRFLDRLGTATYRRMKPIIALAAVAMLVSAWGIGLIRVNDNPIKWFAASHPIREADRVLNNHFGGTYMAYLALDAGREAFEPQAFATAFSQAAAEHAEGAAGTFSDAAQVRRVFDGITAEAVEAAQAAKSRIEALDSVAAYVAGKAEAAEGEEAFIYDEAATFVEGQKQAATEVFKDPAALAYVSELQRVMKQSGAVGKSNSLADIVKTVYRDLTSGAGADASAGFRIPANRRMVAESLMQFQNSHRPQDLWHFVTPDYRTSSVWVQLTSGDNREMSRVVAAVDDYIANYPPPVPLSREWFGLTYINVVWQQKMVMGMLQSFAGSFLVVFLLMAILFRSALWGLLSMIPLTVTIAAIYGAIGIVGKDYDMPVAVLSSLTLGLAVDFAIHFLTRARTMYERYGSWEATAPAIFGEPARAIARNIIVIAAGFLPLLLAPLVPYRTVGALLAIILLVSGGATLLLMPALVRLFERRLFARAGEPVGATCNCALCTVSAVTLVVIVALNLHQYAAIGWSSLTWASVIGVPILAGGCGILSRREKCGVARAGVLSTRTPVKEEIHETVASGNAPGSDTGAVVDDGAGPN